MCNYSLQNTIKINIEIIKNKEVIKINEIKDKKEKFDEMQKIYKKLLIIYSLDYLNKYIDLKNFYDVKRLSMKKIELNLTILNTLLNLSNYTVTSCIDYLRFRIPVNFNDEIKEFIKNLELNSGCNISDEKVKHLFDIKDIYKKITLTISSIFNYIGIEFDKFIREDKGMYGYSYCYKFSNIKVYVADIKKIDELGILIELSGKGCRDLEIYFKIKGISWVDFLKQLNKYDVKFTRVDLALDDFNKIFNIKDFYLDFEEKKVTSSMKIIRPIKNLYYDEEILGYKEEITSFYIGSMKSEIHFCFYDKDVEQSRKNNIEIDDFFGNRYELRFKDKMACDVINSYIENKNLFSIIGYFLYNKISFNEECKNSILFNILLDYLERENIVLSKEVKKEYDEKIEWLKSSVSSVLNMILYVDIVKNNLNQIDVFKEKKYSGSELKSIFNDFYINKNSLKCLVDLLNVSKTDLILDLREKGFKVDEV